MSFPAGNHRFLYNNLLTAANATPSEVAAGWITQATKEVAVGGAVGRPGGSYTGLTEKEWVVEIDSVAGGTSIGQATFRYSSNGGTSWAATGQATSTTPVTLASGITFVWVAAVIGADFALGDRWRFKTILPHGLEAALDYQDRNRTFRTANVTGMKTVDIDLGAAAQARYAALLDHDFTSAVTAKIRGNSAASWGTPPVDETIAYAAGKMARFLTTSPSTYRYWRFELTDAANPAGYLDLSTLFLGDYLELATRKLSVIPWDQRALRAGITADAKSTGYQRETVESIRQEFPLHYAFLTATDYDALVAMRDACWDATNKLNRPLIFVPDHTVPTAAHVVYLEDFTLVGKYPTGYAGNVVLREVARV